MRVNDDNAETRRMMCWSRVIGEIIGGSQREERMDILVSRMSGMGMRHEDYWWYIDSRKYGKTRTAEIRHGIRKIPHASHRTTNIRDVIPFPRTPRKR